MPDDSESANAAFAPLLLRRVTVVRALKVSAVIGTLLILINQGDMLWAGVMPPYWKIILTYLVPYGVSSYSTAALLHERGE
ncbi:nitrate/nitrite transporter NrtS [Parasphingopyxis algicola]|uniref:nitrate/nitrite transporter NrtS n=1 Tax=Parasphingopyxis algicola TaxID=2026624 RepID=UPI00159FC9F6|nr:nitrate/nitrite transporter NrtS [Parasphingopyxis algicola]QLC25224.1 nitrate/nitrite transporter NrtS [Parasphingopyxis algicola]